MNDSKYFRLFEESILVSGNPLSAIYNLLNGNIYDIDQNEYNTLTLLESGLSIYDIQKNDLMFNIKDFLNKLVQADLGFYSKQYVYIDKNIASTKWVDGVYLSSPLFLHTAYIILTSECHQDCLSCHEGVIKGKNCIGCFKEKTPDHMLKLEEYKTLLPLLKELGVKNIFFTGGDITINFERNLEIIKLAHSLGFDNLYCFLGGNRKIPKEIINSLNKHHVHKMYQIEVDIDFDPSNNKLFNSIIEDNNSTVIFLTVGYMDTVKFKPIIDKVSSLINLSNVYIDFLVHKDNITTDVGLLINQIQKPSFLSYAHLYENNGCMSNRITIFNDGRISFCPRLKPIGTIENIYSGLVKDLTTPYWKLTHEKIEKCKNCRFRYSCIDCRFIETCISGSLEKTSTCPR